jgi:hypothetical protein
MKNFPNVVYKQGKIVNGSQNASIEPDLKKIVRSEPKILNKSPIFCSVSGYMETLVT